MEISSVKLVNNDGSEHVGAVEYDQSQEIVKFSFNQNLNPTDKAIIHIEFTGILNDKMKGFYRSKYYDQEGKERFAAVTQFEATNARRCFPCWDVS